MTGQALPILPPSAPFAPDHITVLNSVMSSTSLAQRQWLAGFLAGYEAASGTAPAAAPAAAPAKKIPLTIAYATDSGNSEEVAANAKKLAAKQGFSPKLVDFADVSAADLAGSKNLLIVAATWGEGDPPERASETYAALMADDAPRFDGVNFSVLALGDSSYVNFCEVGKRLDERLEQLGGSRAADRVDADLDFERPAAGWTGDALARISEIAKPEPAAEVLPSAEVFDFPTSAYSKANPFPAEITELVNLNGSRSAKQTFHVELSLEGSGLTFEPGDAIGIIPENHEAMIAEIMMAAGLAGDSDLERRLRTDVDITQLSKPVMEAFSKARPNAKLQELLEGDAWQAYFHGRQIIDLLTDFPAKLEAEELVGLFRKLPPRLYSVASSLKAEPDLAHLLISAVRYESFGRAREGVASTFVADRHKVGDQLKVYVKSNKNFRLPEDPDRPVIMIGPGTGVAPFRAFLQERQATGAAGRNWLFFGDRNYTHDFLYQLDWQDFEKDGVLDRIDVAFSRDQPEKIYVQQRLWERRADLFAWLEEGAALYVCGDEKAMAKDVDAMLQKIIAESGADPAEYVSRLKKERRYQRDVY
ncbi:MAG: flavodoxin domain-containing protein [Alphaproteobacteria bacterium]